MDFYKRKIIETNIKLPIHQEEWIVVKYENHKGKFIKSVKFNSKNQINIENAIITKIKIDYDEYLEKNIYKYKIKTTNKNFDLWVNERVIWV